MWLVQSLIYINYAIGGTILACLLWQYGRSIAKGYLPSERVAFYSIVAGGLSRKEILELIWTFAFLIVMVALIDWLINNGDTLSTFLHLIFRFK